MPLTIYAHFNGGLTEFMNMSLVHISYWRMFAACKGSIHSSLL